MEVASLRLSKRWHEIEATPTKRSKWGSRISGKSTSISATKQRFRPEVEIIKWVIPEIAL